MPGKSTDINLRRVLTHRQTPPPSSQTWVLVALDIEKAFDTVIWDYMLIVLQSLWIRPHPLQMDLHFV